MRVKPGLNPFYVLLVLVGVAFCLTACVYGLMAMRSLRPERSRAAETNSSAAASSGPHQLMAYMERNGERLLLIEVAVLAAAAFAAMATDGYWARRAVERDKAERAARQQEESTS